MDELNKNWTDVHAALLGDFIAALNRYGIRFFILRNYEELPEKNPSKDVDVIIEPGGYGKAAELLQAAYLKYGFVHLMVLEFEKVHCVYGANTVDRLSIHIDLIEGYRHKGFEIFPFDEFYAHTHEYRDFRVLDEDYDTVVMLYYKLFAAKKLIPRYRERVSAGFARCPERIAEIIRRTSGKKMGGRIVELLKSGDYSALGKMSGTISKATKKMAFVRRPFRTLWRIGFFCAQKFRTIVICPRCKRKFISVLGPDGVGKSTFIDLLEKKLNFYYVADGDKCQIIHHRPGRLPNLGALGEKAKLMKEDTNFTVPHRSKPANAFSSFLRMTYYWLDYLLFVPLIVRRNAKWDFVTVFDRYIYDFLVDPRRSRINLPYRIRKCFAATVPQPQLVFILLTDAEIIYARKPELSREEIARQQQEYLRLAGSSSRFVLLDASQTPEQLTDQAAECILKGFSTGI